MDSPKTPAQAGSGNPGKRPFTAGPPQYVIQQPLADSEYNEQTNIRVIFLAPDVGADHYRVTSDLVPETLNTPTAAVMPLDAPTESNDTSGVEGHLLYEFTITAPNVTADRDLIISLLFREDTSTMNYVVKRSRIVRIKFVS